MNTIWNSVVQSKSRLRQEMAGYYVHLELVDQNMMDDLDTHDLLFVHYNPAEEFGFILLEKGGVLFEAEPIFESCHGLSAPWVKEPTTVASIRERLKVGMGTRITNNEAIDVYANALAEACNQLNKEGYE